MKGVPLRLAAMASDRSLMFDPRSDVAGYCNRSNHFTLLIVHHRERHFDIQLVACLVDRTGQGRAAVQPCVTTCHRRFEAAPVCGAQMFRDDHIEVTAQGLFGTVAEQHRGSTVPAHDCAGPVGIDDGVSRLFDDPFR